jgi:DNA repair protein RadC
MRTELQGRPAVNSWDKLIDYISAKVARSKAEEFHILFLDRKKGAAQTRAPVTRYGRPRAGP